MSSIPTYQYTDVYRNHLRYYKYIFPYEPFLTWMKYGNMTNLLNREFALRLANNSHMRYQSISCPDDLKGKILKHCPLALHLGAVYNSRPTDRRAPSFTAIERELVFDLDLSAYDDVRTCCRAKYVYLFPPPLVSIQKLPRLLSS